ncbi:hypothetical protein [Bradyrhizobium vignae]|uniref:hypothetical protein n=1 Tax=Bradyrhizobium vignae TaxID=1549949 RepID=UPI001FCE39E1|nr:hypothetical protein [Bradyrhizobium vignae]
MTDEFVDVPCGGGLGDFRKFRPFRRRKFSFKSIKEAIEHQPLTLIKLPCCVNGPEVRLAQNTTENVRAIEGAI